MKCPKCNSENKENAKVCKNCNYDFNTVVLWQPTWKWHFKTLAIIYAILIVVYILLNILLKPYLRQIPKDITPWLNEVPKNESVG